MELIASHRVIDLARISVIVACVGLLYSPTVASAGLIVSYAAFLVSGEAFVRFRPMLSRPIVYWGLAFLGIVLLATLYSSVSWQDRLVGFSKWRTVLWALVLLALFDRQRWKERLLIAFIVGTAIGVIASFAAAGGLITFKRGPEGVLRNSSTQGMVFAVSALICLWMWLDRKWEGRFSWIWAVFASLYIANVVFITPGLSGYAVLGLGTGVLVMWRIPPRYWIVAGLGISLLGVTAFSLSHRMQDRVNRSLDQWTHANELEGHTSLGSRRVFHGNAIEMAKEHWLLGVGTGGFRKAYAEHVAGKYEASDWRAEPTGDPHNQYLAIWVQQGLVGLVVFFLWLIAIARDQGTFPRYRQLALAIFVGWCMTSLFSSHFTTFAEGHLIATFLGALLAVPSTEGEVKPEFDSRFINSGMPC
ncbi:O-antigen ligase family protein [Petrachloros mirabilis]